jgi:hypothetical protein
MASVSRNRMFLPGKLNRAKAYPPRIEISSVTMTVPTETTTLFAKYVGNPSWNSNSVW